ncbi:hypothetical protein PPL_09327 [Heterostelium album PN500]|uniref:Uncharacterized protein n=1 Tax=Heterostelium pallidum (strain ATCC 26659 / Pp 5 / PN500) TaxID=670386 RepID=D3BL95_HETP5|nr:hypothetical protein PPL_09327 [Heterostelium album PN500]EFA77829.1 hypothetical protein PPL_09327 [Heterostelium album PN500]|eukprot:XP_020429957.1 hypothetical protein PPL_09327 [Heterostelium album PN500]
MMHGLSLDQQDRDPINPLTQSNQKQTFVCFFVDQDIIIIYNQSINQSTNSLGDIVRLNSDKCVDLGCGFSMLLGETPFPKESDDVIVYSSNPAIPKLVVLSQHLNVKSLNISSGYLKMEQGASINSQSDLLIGDNAGLEIAGSVFVNSLLNCRGILSIRSGNLSVNGVIKVSGNFSMYSGSIETVDLQISEIIDDFTVFYGGSLKISGTGTVDSLLMMRGNAQLVINSGIVNFYNGLECKDKTMISINRGQLHLGGHEECLITSSLVLGAESVLNVSASIARLRGSIVNKFTASKIVVSRYGKLELGGKTNLLSKVTLERDAIFSVCKGTCSLTSMDTDPTSLIQIDDNGTLNMLGKFNIKSSIELQSTGQLVIDGTTSITGNITDTTGAIIHLLGGDFTFSNNSLFIIKSDILVDNKASLSVSGNISLYGNLVFSDSSNLAIAPESIVNFGGKNTKILVDIILPTSSQLNCLANSTTKIQRITQADLTSKISIDHLATLTIGDGCTILTPIRLHGNSSLFLSGDSSVSFINATTIDGFPLPLIYISDCKCNLKDQNLQLGIFTIERSDVQLVGKIDILEMLMGDSESTISIGAKSVVSLLGDGSTIDSSIKVMSGGKLLIDGSTDLTGINVEEDAYFAVNSSAIVNIDGECSFGSPFIATGTAIINLKTGCQFFQGVIIPNNSTVLNIYGSPGGDNVFFYGNTSIKSPVTCGSMGHITIPPDANCLFNGGLSLSDDSDFNIIGSTCTIGKSSRMVGRTILSNYSTLITDSRCLFYGGIQSLDKTMNKLIVKSGYCQLDIESKISGTVEVNTDAILYVNTPLTVTGGVTNNGLIQVSAMFDITGSSFLQDSNDARLVLIKSQISAKTVTIESGRLLGDGTVATTHGFTNGGVMEGVFKIGDKLPILSAGGLSGKLSLADTNCSSSFQLSAFGPIYNLVYQSIPKSSIAKEQQSTGNTSIKLSISINILILSLLLSILTI